METKMIGRLPVNYSTRMSLNDRFTQVGRARRNLTTHSYRLPTAPPAPMPAVNAGSLENRRLLREMAKRQTMKTAIKLKRRSVRQFGSNRGPQLQRGTIKALRIGANGRPMKANSLTTYATMNADLLPNARQSLRRSSSLRNLSNYNGNGRSTVGGAAERYAARQMQRARSRSRGRAFYFEENAISMMPRARSRSRSRLTQYQQQQQPVVVERSRSRSRTRQNQQHQQFVNAGRAINAMQRRGRSASRSRNFAQGAAATMHRFERARSQSRGRNNANVNNMRVAGRSRARSQSRNRVPITSRLGVRRGNNGNVAQARGRQRARSINGRLGVGAGRNPAGGNTGRIQKRSASRMRNVARGNGARVGRARERSAIRNNGTRTRSAAGRAGYARDVGQRRGGGSASNNIGRRRGRSQQRNGNNNNTVGKRNGNIAKGNGNGQQQQRRGRSRSRGGARAGKNERSSVKKDDLDKELDTYMSAAKTEDD